MSSPPVSVCPSTTTLGRFTTSQGSRHNSDSDSESDDASLDIIDAGNPSHSSGRPRPQSQAPPRGRGILDSDADDPLRAPSSSNTRSHRRHLSLSPLRTLFPTRNPRESGHALSAQSTPSTHSLAFSRSSPFFRSTTSLRNLTSSTPLPPPSPSSPPSLRSEFLASRRFFSHKGKERATSESLDSWEIVESEDLPVPTTPPAHEEHSPIYDIRPGDIPPPSPVSVTSAPVHPLSERDRQVKSRNRAPVPPTLPSPQRERERRAPPPLAGPVLAAGEAPPIVTVRTKKPPPPPPPKKKPTVPSPLRDVDGSCALPELDLDRAMRTPLPLTPVTGSPTSLLFPFSMDPGSPARERIDNIPSPVPRSSSGASENGTVNTVDVEGQQSHQHHYPGRPLPRRPRVVVDSTYAPHPDFPQVELLRPAPSVPEGLLINLDADAVETPTAQAVHTEPFASVSADLDQLTPVATSSADLNQLTPMATDVRRHSSASSVDLAPAAPPAEFLELTELDILIARLENDQRDGGNYDVRLCFE
ncbi:hypothetical protein B0H19DRAFT_294114 [Mycena capillaripes]|nr:hypothetical protein B0H19DRAFT_294114 [Mycena capillaripes]